MVSSTRQAIAGILVIFSAAVLVRAQTVQPKEPNATITGKVTIKGKGAPGIFIGLRRQETSYPRQLTGFRAVTDSEGKYRIENVTAGAYVVIPVAPAYISEETSFERVLIVNKGETIENVDFVLVRGGAITGKVIDAEGRPLIEEDVFAVANPENTRAYMGPAATHTRTDDRGFYRLYGLPKGRYRVAAGNQGYSRSQRASYKQIYHPGVEDITHATVIEVSEGSETINIDLTLGATISTYTASGRIVDGQTGEPLPNISYGVTRYFGDNGSSSSSSNVVSNSRGEFRLENLAPGKYGVSAQDRTSGEWRAEEVQFEVIDQDVTGLVVRAEKAATISGVIVIEGTDDKSVREQLTKAHMGASVSREGSHRGYGSSTTPSPDGSFRITGLGSGMATFSIYSTSMFRIVRVERNGIIQPRHIEIKPGEQVTGVRIFVNYGNASIRGVVTVANGTLPPGGRFYVSIRRINDPNTSAFWSDATRQMDSRGHFIIEYLVPGTYEINAGFAVPEARTNGFNKIQEVVVTAGSTNNVTITLDLSSTRPGP